MRIDEFTRLLDAKPSGRNTWKARCPAHDDRKESLSVSVGKNGAIILKCHAGCDNSDILNRMGLKYSDLYPDTDCPSVTYKSQPVSKDSRHGFNFNDVVAIYTYSNGTRKLRDREKNFCWQHLKDNEWKPRRGDAPHVLYKAGKPQETLFIVEGEKDADTMGNLGFYALSSENGAGGQSKWIDSYNTDVAGKNVFIIPDNDVVGHEFADAISDRIKGIAKSVRIVDLKSVWSEIKEHQDVSDMVECLGADEATKRIRMLSQTKTRRKSLKSILVEMKPETKDRYRATDIGNSNLFSDVYKDIARYCADRGRWYIYDGKRWMPDSIDGTQTMQLCKRLADALLVYASSIEDADYVKAVAKWQNRNTRKTVLLDAQDCYPVKVSDFDKDIYLFNCQNGTLDLRTMEFKPHRPQDLLSKISGVNYDPDAKCVRWNRFIDEIMQGDNDKARFLQKALGYSLTGDTREECFFILYGATSRNGKGTLMETFKRIMGDYGKATSPETIAQKDRTDSSKPSEDVARLAGARFVNISEPDKNLVLSSALIKTLTGNDTIQARYLHEHIFEYQPQFKIFVNTNHLPRVTDSTVFSSDRIKVIPFERHFVESERDTSLKRQFSDKANQSAVLNWCLDGFKSYQAEGLSVPASVQKATTEYMMDSDDIARFMADELEVDYKSMVKTSDVYERYKEWCDRNGFMQKSIKTFSQELKQRNVDILAKKRPPTGGNPCSMILARRLR